jgi:hypothetical protein
MKYEFNANEISYTFENGIHILGIADAKDEAQDFIILQRETEHTEQDKKLGQDTYYIEVCADGAAGYGGVKSIFLSANLLNIEIKEDATWRNDLSAIKINIQAIKNIDNLKAGILAIFRGQNVVTTLI